MDRIYVLIDPRNSEIRYVGWTSKSLQRRLVEHVSSRKRRTYRSSWVKSLYRLGLIPQIQLLQEVPAGSGPSAESYWISFFRAQGCPLTNLTEGGEGTVGYRHTDTTRAKMSSERRGKPKPGAVGRRHSAETKAKIRAAALRQFQDSDARAQVGQVHKGKVISEEHKKRVAEAARLRWQKWRESGGVTSDETRAKISAARTGKPVTDETKAKISAYQKGREKTPEHRAKISKAIRSSRTKEPS